jgi:hypothetical protein
MVRAESEEIRELFKVWKLFKVVINIVKTIIKVLE